MLIANVGNDSAALYITVCYMVCYDGSSNMEA